MEACLLMFRAEQGRGGWSFSVSSQHSAFVLNWAKTSDPESLFGLTCSENKLPVFCHDVTVFLESSLSASIKIKNTGASLVAQWLRIRLPVQGTQIRSLVREDPTYRRATKPVCHNY